MHYDLNKVKYFIYQISLQVILLNIGVNLANCESFVILSLRLCSFYFSLRLSSWSLTFFFIHQFLIELSFKIYIIIDDFFLIVWNWMRNNRIEVAHAWKPVSESFSVQDEDNEQSTESSNITSKDKQWVDLPLIAAAWLKHFQLQNARILESNKVNKIILCVIMCAVTALIARIFTLSCRLLFVY